MNVEYHKMYSGRIGREMEFKSYGWGGKPVVVFPSSGGRFYEYEDFGMTEACKPFIERGVIRLYTPDSIDREAGSLTLRRATGPGATTTTTGISWTNSSPSLNSIRVTAAG